MALARAARYVERPMLARSAVQCLSYLGGGNAS